MRRALFFSCLLLLVAVSACRRNNNIVVPNRVLDRPLDVALTCMKLTESGTIQALPLAACDRITNVGCSAVEETQLIAFIANSQRNEVALARRCDETAAVVDMDDDSPGYQLIPVGQMPSHITATELGCRVVTSNAGSCDLSVLEAPGFAGYALEQPPPEAPASLVSRLVPLRSDGVPIGARPGVVISVPDDLSLAGAPDNEPPPDPPDSTDGGGGETGPDATGTATGDDSGAPEPTSGLPPVEFSECPPGKLESVWVTFPSCQLVAEVSLNSAQILQSRRFELDADGNVTVLDGGTTPDCPIDCPIQFEDGLPPVCESEGDTDTDSGGEGECREEVDPEGFFPVAIEPVVDFELGPDSTILPYPALFVGGLGSDTIVEIQFEGDAGEESGQWAEPDSAPMLTLERAQGVHAIRSTPVLDARGGRQFLYVIAGDGATHVVERSFDRDVFGNECDTQIDATVPTPDPLCNAIPPTAVGTTPSPDRRAGFVGPGIRASSAAITDWTFFKVTPEDLGVENQEAVEGDPWTPFQTPGVIGVGVTSFGHVVLSVFDQLLDEEPRNQNVDPVGVMNLSVAPHSLWPVLNPTTIERGDESAGLPVVDDEEPDATFPGAPESTQGLSPSLRRIDFAYSGTADDPDLSPERQHLAEVLGEPTNLDALGSFDGESVYETEAPRVAVRDYQTWRGAQWTLQWEGTISSQSNTGRIACDTPGWENGTCIGGDAGESRIIDEAASFCDEGVLPGDKLVLLGCNSDDDCGLGQKCLREPTAPSSAGGICVSSTAYEEEFNVLRQVCAPFLTDACGTPRLEYVVTDAFQNELWLRPTDIQKSTHLRLADPTPATAPNTQQYDSFGNQFQFDEPAEDWVPFESEESYTCELPYAVAAPDGGGVCTSDADCRDVEGRGPDRCVITSLAVDTAAHLTHLAEVEAEANDLPPPPPVVPTGACQRIVTCTETAECEGAEQDGALCMDGVCRGPCAAGDPECYECGDDTECEHYGPESICSDGKCMRPCESGSPDCTLARLPGPRCFPELVQYVVRARNSFLVIGQPDIGIYTDRVIADPTTGRCREDPTVSSLLTSRIRLGADEAETFGGVIDYPYVIPDCPNANEAAPSDPNPCRITQSRLEDEGSLFHTFAFNGNEVAAIRYSNPFMSIVLDLTDLRALASEVEQFPGEFYPDDFHAFRRGRIPRGYAETFLTIPGYVPYQEPVVIGSTVMVYPVRIVTGPEFGAAFIVDAGGRGGPAGVRGQLIRIETNLISQGGGEMPDTDFLVR